MSKILGRIVLALLVLLILVIGALHLPPVQTLITRKLAGYLTSKTEARVDIERIRFSLFGNVGIENLNVQDPFNNNILSAREIAVSVAVADLLKGNLVFDDIRLAGVDGTLIQSENGLNIQFLLDAFRPAEQHDTTPSAPVAILFRNILLEEILFAFNSTVTGTSLGVNLGTFTCTGGKFSTQPTAIQAEKLFLQNTVLNVLSAPDPDTLSHADTTRQHHLLLPDFGTGIALQIQQVELDNNTVSFHRGPVAETEKFDPEHITLKNIAINLSDIVMREDLLEAELRSLTAQLPGFELTQAQAGVKVNPDEVIVSGLRVVSGSNELRADLTVPNNWRTANQTGEVRADIHMQINPSDLAYFLTDSMMHLFQPFGPAQFTVDAFYSMGKGEINSLNLKTGTSTFHASGKVNDLFDLDAIAWNDLVVTATIGSDFRHILAPFLQPVTIPPNVKLRLTSSGNRKQLSAEASVISGWGDVLARGHLIQKPGNTGFDGSVTGEQVDLGKWLAIDALGSLDLTVQANGSIGDHPAVTASGMFRQMEILDQQVNQIIFQSEVLKDSANVSVSVNDANYRAALDSKIVFEGPLSFTNMLQLDSFRLGTLLQLDSSLMISGNTRSKIIIDPHYLEGFVEGRKMFFHKQSFEYALDSMKLHALLSPANSEFTYRTDYAAINLESNFDLREAGDVIRQQTEELWNTENPVQLSGTRTARFNLKLEDASIFKLFGIAVDDFSMLQVNGEFNEQQQEAILQASTGKFRGYGISLDTLHSSLGLVRDSIITSLHATNLYYDSIKLGQLDFNILTSGDTAVSNLQVASDTITLLDLGTRIVSVDSGWFFYPDTLRAFNQDYFTDRSKPVYLGKNQLAFDHFTISRDSMEIILNGDVNAFDASFRNLNLTVLNVLVSPDTVLINNGLLSGNVSYTRGQHLNLTAAVDSLILYQSIPITLTARAESDGKDVPFDFRLSNSSNLIDLKGTYFTDNSEVAATLILDMAHPELLKFMVSDVIEDLHGSVTGRATINGPLKKPAFKGSIQFTDVGITTVNPRFEFNLKKDSLVLDQSSVLFNRFTLYDPDNNPLTIDGYLTVTENQSLDYELQINSDRFTLINQPDSVHGKVRGLLVMDSDIKVKGDDKNKSINANLTVRDATALTFLVANDDVDLVSAEGIIEFVDPALLMDSVALGKTNTVYDSLIATLPDFNLKAAIRIEENAGFRLLIDEQSGDYLAVSGGANLELESDRTGNLKLAGNYTIREGVYRLSFYDLVKKNFELMPGSSVIWSGNPQNGELSIKAVNTVESNSIGLIGHEIGENEKSIYQRSLKYQVGINISGTIEKPIISFSLDLPQNEKNNYPVLANKLDRLQQPEHESELNKQVFGLLVLGGFIPESSSSDINSSAIATTALANSVNSILASQLNRFASQYIKGVNIDVGIQSYSDFSTPGGQTQTAMDFRVSKSVMNERLSFEIGGDFNLNQDQSGANTGTKNYRGDIAIVYDLTGNGDKVLKLFSNETFDIVYQEIKNTGISLIFIRDFDHKQKRKRNPK